MNAPIHRNDMIRTAAYLRCYPYDSWEMSFHHAALRRHAVQSGLPEPDCYLDNGRPSRGPLPQLRQLLLLVAAGVYQAVLVPGPFVFSLHDDVARDLIRRINADGCTVLELPRPHPQTLHQETTGLRESVPRQPPSQPDPAALSRPSTFGWAERLREATSSAVLPRSTRSLD
ncbi:hypothetical protein ACQEV2_23500 [Streptomyces sp. CA-251387]|uniref:hypothetical protein n=1 Tax=Streptomyces sp. CA-251387 TaxID=3240064 RepID=UPI003D913E27